MTVGPGRLLAATTFDGEMDLYDRGTLAKAATLAGDGSGDSGVALWNLEPADWVDAACAIAGRNLTRDELAPYLIDLGDYDVSCPQYPAGT